MMMIDCAALVTRLPVALPYSGHFGNALSGDRRSQGPHQTSALGLFTKAEIA
ncbi:hypothetical protein I3J27_07350 [Bradyrhizobium xenonodulans]|uniref:Transposase n=1 Tax=Bradyrhizobium xenonodulans TaxID=2736875 RepID=A0ABY7MPY9_9BRAD|nr:hypothetical protein [Bradyrhizobium xenonodulans]WBL80234.1 hypothetical protein I3J27_07350 [Bradyrhizobium xenonodulans]